MSTGVRPRRREAEVLRVVREYREALDRRDRRALLRFGQESRSLAASVDREARDLARRIRAAEKAGEAVRPSWLHTSGRLDEITAQVRQDVQAFAVSASHEVRSAAADALALGQRAAGASVATLTGLSDSVVAATYPAGAIRALSAVTEAAAPVGRIFAEFGDDAAGRLREEITRGVALGEHPTRIASRMRAAAVDLPLRRARTIARTEALRAYRTANVSTFAAVPEIDGWTWVAALDGRTCGSCYALHGTEWPDGAEMESHPNCRCVPAPRVPGQPPLVTPGADLLSRMSEEDLAARFGPGKAAALADRRILPEDLIGSRRSPVWGTTRTEASLRGALENAARRRPRSAPPPPPVPEPETWGPARAVLNDAGRRRADEHFTAEIGHARSAAFRISERLRDHAGFNRAAQVWDKGKRERLGDPPRDYANPEHQDRAREALSKKFMDSWAGTSGDSSAMAVSLQEAAREEFGLAGTASPWDVTPDVTEAWRAQQLGDGSLDPIRAYLRAQYEQTQEALSAAGIERVTVTRGWAWYRDPPDWARDLDLPEPAVIEMAPMSSYTSDFGTASAFSGSSGSGMSKTLLSSVEVDRRQVIGYGPHGFGTDYENEWVLLGGRVEQLAWDPRVVPAEDLDEAWGGP